ncbi:MAG: hypothetical protein EPO65_04765 [Dehalococcoidia bacterium]|nr:MAG: hypothetical protein EPO65_04765 [Dehalococcoidia bacterium]
MALIDDHITTYLQALEIEGKTAKTVASYANSLAAFRSAGERLGFPDHPADYDVSHVYAFLGDLRARGASAGYQHRRHREVKTCFSWLKRMGIVDENVFAKVPLVKRPQLIKPPFSPDEVQRLLECSDRTTATGARNYALILFLLDTGIRASECIDLRLADVDWDRSRAFIRHGKGEKQRWVGFGSRTASAVRDYVDRFRGDHPGALLLTSAGEAMTAAGTLEVLLRRLGERAGVAKVHPHRFRHTFATWAIESGAREIDVQMLLGHSDLTMTQRYARTYTSEQAVRAHPELSPVNRLAG